MADIRDYLAHGPPVVVVEDEPMTPPMDTLQPPPPEGHVRVSTRADRVGALMDEYGHTVDETGPLGGTTGMQPAVAETPDAYDQVEWDVDPSTMNDYPADLAGNQYWELMEEDPGANVARPADAEAAWNEGMLSPETPQLGMSGRRNIEVMAEMEIAMGCIEQAWTETVRGPPIEGHDRHFYPRHYRFETRPHKEEVLVDEQWEKGNVPEAGSVRLEPPDEMLDPERWGSAGAGVRQMIIPADRFEQTYKRRSGDLGQSGFREGSGMSFFQEWIIEHWNRAGFAPQAQQELDQAVAIENVRQGRGVGRPLLTTAQMIAEPFGATVRSSDMMTEAAANAAAAAATGSGRAEAEMVRHEAQRAAGAKYHGHMNFNVHHGDTSIAPGTQASHQSYTAREVDWRGLTTRAENLAYNIVNDCLKPLLERARSQEARDREMEDILSTSPWTTFPMPPCAAIGLLSGGYILGIWHDSPLHGALDPAVAENINAGISVLWGEYMEHCIQDGIIDMYEQLFATVDRDGMPLPPHIKARTMAKLNVIRNKWDQLAKDYWRTWIERRTSTKRKYQTGG